jgi:glycosyltransferase involved in cell wall biosynthesis
MRKTKVVLITEYFPYSYDYEIFLEKEIKYWEEQKDIQLIILPMYKNNNVRNIPPNIIIDNSLADYLATKEYELETNNYKILHLLNSLKNKIFWKEIFREIIKQPSLIQELLFSLRKFDLYKNFFQEYLKTNNIDIFYTYWYTEVTYALQDFKNKDKYKLVTRVHGYDLYKERTFKNYMPLRTQFTKDIDKIFTLSNKAITYMMNVYGYKKELLKVSRLGVEDLNIITKPSEENNLNIVSCSSLIPIKRVDKIIDTLSLLAKKQPNLYIKWTHIGDGKLYNTLYDRATKKLKDKNINFIFLGFLSNKEVFEFYKKNEVDLFFNLSASEGVPVSIMEAMSCHIPIVAPDIGGISDMVISDFNGALLSSSPEIEEIVRALKDTLYFKKESIRNNSYEQYKKKYNATKNYYNFIHQIIY